MNRLLLKFSILLGFVLLFSCPAIAECGAVGHCCLPVVEEWVGFADGVLSFDLGIVRCPTDEEMVIVRLGDRDGDGGELTVELSYRDDAFRRVGALGVQPVLEIEDWDDVPAPQRRRFDEFVAWLVAHQGDVVLHAGVSSAAIGSHPDWRTPPGPGWLPGWFWFGPWLWLTALLLIGAGWLLKIDFDGDLRRSVKDMIRRMWAPAGIVVLAASLRALLGVWGPHHVNGQGPGWISRAVYGTAGGMYGSGYAELYNMLVHVLPGSAESIVYSVNVLLGAVLAGVVYSLTGLLTCDRRPALLAGLVVALDPLLIRHGASESYLISIAVLAALTARILAPATGAMLNSSGRLRLAGLLQAAGGGLLAAQASRIHPAAWPLLLLVPIVILAVPNRDRRHGRLPVALTAGGVMALSCLVTSAWPLLHCLSATYTRIHRAVFPDIQFIWLLPAALAAIALVPTQWRRWRPLLVTSAVTCLLLFFTNGHYQLSGQYKGWHVRTHWFALLPIPALAVSVLMRRLPAAALVLPALLYTGLTQMVHPDIWVDTTEQRETKFYAEVLSKQPQTCVLVAPRSEETLPNSIPIYVPRGETYPLQNRYIEVDRHTAGSIRERFSGCVLYIEPSPCAYEGAHEECLEVRRRLGRLRPVDSRTLPAVSSTIDQYPNALVEVSVFHQT